MVDDFVPSGFVPYFPELVYVHSAFAAVILLKVSVLLMMDCVVAMLLFSR